MYLDASKGATYVEKKFISADLAKLAGSLLLMSPKLVEQLSSSSILIPFDELTSDPFWRMIEELRKENV